ncbi:MAG: LD-carboxypeptidase [Deltaproteobacteria bacterium]|nr:LD-carboxypeptidase [Deltaproteobacteria bacterium]
MGKIRPLKKGSLIGIAAPASPFDRRKFRQAIQNLCHLGFRTTFQNGIFSKKQYLAGDDKRRSREINRLLNNPRVEAILFARGGYGSARLLPLLPKKISNFKAIMGLSDLTILLGYLWKRYRLPTLYGPLVAPHLKDHRYADKVLRALSEPDFFKRQSLAGTLLIRPGRSRGRLVGGCLSLVVSSLATPYEVDTCNTLLFLEDTEEEPYAVDRMVTQLIQAGKLRMVKGIILGSFCWKKRPFPKEILEVFRDRLGNFQGPVLWGVPFGHLRHPSIIPHGGVGRIEGRKLFIEKGIF